MAARRIATAFKTVFSEQVRGRTGKNNFPLLGF
jgi:hypothetical protein